MGRVRWAVALAAGAAAATAGAATTPSAERPLLTYVVAPMSRNDGQSVYRGLCATDLHGHTFRVSDPHDNVNASWSPGGRLLTFTRRDNNAGQDHLGDVFVTDAQGRQVRNLTRDGGRGGFYVFGWSPDGSEVAIGWSGLGSGLYVQRTDGKGGHGLVGVDFGYGDFVYGGSWSPDGSRILFTMGLASSNQVPATYVIDADGTNRRKLLDSTYGASWSPDGRQFAYLAFDEDRTVGLGVANADGSGAHLLVEGAVGGPLWSPDGRQIAYSSAGALKVIQADGSRAHLLAHGLTGGVAWSPDGSLIAFTRGPQGSPRLALIKPDGTGEHTVATGGLPASGPAWRISAPLPIDRRPCVVRGSSRADVIRGTDRGDLIYAGAGDDLVYGNGGDDTLLGEGGQDRLYGSRGEDALFGGRGHDRLYGGRGRDALRAKDKVRDFLFGGPEEDIAIFDPVDVVKSIDLTG